MLFAAVIGALLWRVTGLWPADAASAVVFFGVVYVVERAIMEAYKTFFREADQSKYTIPMQFAVFGKVVTNRGLRALLGFCYLGIMLVTVWLITMFQRVIGGPPPLWAIFIIGAAGGWISAFGGAWKDAPIEGFQIFKFFRSPLMAGTYALLMSLLTSDLVFITLAAEGFVIATTETYKTFFFPSKPRGKFASKPVIFPEWLKLRQFFVPLYVAIWLGVIATYVVAGYPVSKYVLAFWLGRLPKFFFLAWLGQKLPLSALQLTVIAVATVVVGYGVAWIRNRRLDG